MKRTFDCLICCVFLLAGCASPEPAQIEPFLLVLNKAENTATLLNRFSGETVEKFVTGVAPHEVAVHPEKGLAVITNYGTNANPGSSLTVVDLVEKSVIKTIGLDRFRRPHGIQFFRDGERVAVTAEGNQSVLVVNISSGEILKVIPTEQRISHMLVLSPDERLAFVSSIGSGSISVLDIEESRLVKVLPVGDGTEGLDISPDGKELWVANRGEDSLVVVDTDRLEVIERMQCESFPIRVRFSPGGEEVLVSNARTGDVAVFSRQDRKEMARVPMELTAKERENRLLDFELSPVPIGIVVDAEEGRAYVANSNADIVSVIELNSWKVVGRLIAGEEPDGMGLFTVYPDPLEDSGGR